MLKAGKNLTKYEKKLVLDAFIYRWTHENKRYVMNNLASYMLPTMETISDEQWLNDHAFYITKRGELDCRYKHCEPAYLAKDQHELIRG